MFFAGSSTPEIAATFEKQSTEEPRVVQWCLIGLALLYMVVF